MGTVFDVDEIAQMSQDFNDQIVPDDGPPLPPLPPREEDEHVAPRPSHAEPTLRDVLECLEAVGARVEELGGEIAGLKEEFANDKAVTRQWFLAVGNRAETSWSRR